MTHSCPSCGADIKAQLAEERTKAREPFLRVADELDATADAAWREAWEAAAERIRRAAEERQQ